MGLGLQVIIILSLLLLLLHACPAKRQGASCRQAAIKGCHNPTPCWTRHIQARPNQPWAQCSVFVPPPASRGHIIIITINTISRPRHAVCMRAIDSCACMPGTGGIGAALAPSRNFGRPVLAKFQEFRVRREVFKTKKVLSA